MTCPHMTLITIVHIETCTKTDYDKCMYVLLGPEVASQAPSTPSPHLIITTVYDPTTVTGIQPL